MNLQHTDIFDTYAPRNADRAAHAVTLAVDTIAAYDNAVASDADRNVFAHVAVLGIRAAKWLRVECGRVNRHALADDVDNAVRHSLRLASRPAPTLVAVTC
jgi:hypothetical protein